MVESLYFDNEPSSPQNVSSRTPGSGLTFRLPPLKSGKTTKFGKKQQSFIDPATKVPRPVKLKPLREVLTRLIVQIKKKDDYAFFLKPVDLRLVPSYADIIQRPMDLGTMTTKVAKGKYRSLEEFASDFRLVTSNAKMFNPPGTIYHSEAERIEAWGLDRITKAAATVIEYETDWNIEIEGEDDRSIANDDDGDDLTTPAPTDENRRSPSIASNQPLGNRRGTRAVATSKKTGNGVSESLEPDGRLPGAKDGIGAFPPGSDWARVILALKLKAKKYRTKKERMRVEKSGPPIAADGSLDYWETEDPFTILEALAPEPASKLLLTPLHPFTTDPSPPSQSSVPPPVNVSLKRKFPHISSELVAPCPKRRHWSISRHSTRGKAKENEEGDAIPLWKAPREPQVSDFGPFAALMQEVADERGIQAIDEEEKLFHALRSDLEACPPYAYPEAGDSDRGDVKEAEKYIQDIVYGGVDGLAYIRSLAEFVGGSAPASDETMWGLSMPLSKWVKDSLVDYVTQGRHRILQDVVNILRDAVEPHSSHHPLPEDLIQVLAEKIDISCLIRTPGELDLEGEWGGVPFKRERRRALELKKESSLTTANGAVKNAAEYLAFAIESHRKGEGLEDRLDEEPDDPEVYAHVLNATGQALRNLLQSSRTGEASMEGESLDMRMLRLNLLALAKRAPVDQVSYPELW